MGDSSFDAKDPKYQVSEDHPPDKSSGWTIPVETDRWVLTNDSIRCELDGMREALAAGAVSDPPPEWAAESVTKWWTGHSRHVKEHCAKQEEMLVPFVAERVRWPEKVKDDHSRVEEWQSEVGAAVDGLQRGEKTIGELRKAWEAYESRLRPCLLEEERTALLLVRAYFTQEEISPVGRKMMEAEPETTVGAMVHSMGEDRFRSVFMKQEGIPFFVWQVAFKGRYKLYKKEMAVHVDALKTGTPPVEEKSGWGFF